MRAVPGGVAAAARPPAAMSAAAPAAAAPASGSPAKGSAELLLGLVPPRAPLALLLRPPAAPAATATTPELLGASAGGAGVGHTEQRRSVRAMERAAAELAEMLESTEVVAGDEPALDTFERQVRELNQLNALRRAQCIHQQSGAAERRGSWSSQLSDKVARSSAVAAGAGGGAEPGGAAAFGAVRWVGAAPLGRRSSRRCTRRLTRRDGAVSAIPDAGPAVTPSTEAEPCALLGADLCVRRSSATGSTQSLADTAMADDTFRVVGSLTPGMLHPPPCHPQGSGWRGAAAVGAPGRRATWFGGAGCGRALRGLGLCQDAAEEGAVAGDDMSTTLSIPSPAEEGGVVIDIGRRSSAPAVLSTAGALPRDPPAPKQRDSSSTRVTGRIDYTALLREQHDDLSARRESTKQYKEMLDCVEEYQRRMIETLDRQLVFMGINDDAVRETVGRVAEGRAAAAPGAGTGGAAAAQQRAEAVDVTAPAAAAPRAAAAAAATRRWYWCPPAGAAATTASDGALPAVPSPRHGAGMP